METVVESAEGIVTLAEARAYYQSKLVRSHTINCRDKTVVIVFERENTHLYSEKVEDIDAIPEQLLVIRNLSRGRREVRQFSIDRATLMGSVLPAISGFTQCLCGSGPPSRATREIYGPRLSCGRYMCVVLRPGPGKAWSVVTAFPIEEKKYRERCRAKPAKFPIDSEDEGEE